VDGQREKTAEDKMLNGYGPYSVIFQLVLVVWFFYLGFLLKKVIKEQQETNRLLRTSGNPGSSPATAQK
jgi:hypothetical protein